MRTLVLALHNRELEGEIIEDLSLDKRADNIYLTEVSSSRVESYLRVKGFRCDEVATLSIPPHKCGEFE